MRTINDGGPAFPVEVDSTQPDGFQIGNMRWQAYGISIRDYFAAKAMASLVSIGYSSEAVNEDADAAYEIADAMLRAREKKASA